jgi:hypothetical protein
VKETLADRIEAMQRRLVSGSAAARRRAYQTAARTRGAEQSAERRPPEQKAAELAANRPEE